MGSVLVSTMTPRRRIDRIARQMPAVALSSAPDEGSEVMRTPARCATAVLDPSACPPARSRRRAAAGAGSWPDASWPGARKGSALAPPIVPRPTMPTGGFRFFMRRRYYAGMRIGALVFTLIVSLTVSPFAPIDAWAQAWPAKPIRMLVPFPPGGGVDYAARIVGKHLSDRLGPPAPVDKPPRGNGIIAPRGPEGAAPRRRTPGTGPHRPPRLQPHPYPHPPPQSAPHLP